MGAACVLLTFSTAVVEHMRVARLSVLGPGVELGTPNTTQKQHRRAWWPQKPRGEVLGS